MRRRPGRQPPQPRRACQAQRSWSPEPRSWRPKMTASAAPSTKTRSASGSPPTRWRRSTQSSSKGSCASWPRRKAGRSTMARLTGCCWSAPLAVCLESLAGELRQGATTVDPGALSSYQLFAFSAEAELHDGVRPERRPLLSLVRVSADEGFPLAWEAVLRLQPGTPPASLPAPAARQLAGEAGRVAIEQDCGLLRDDRVGWVARAREDLDDIQARYQRQIRAYPDAQRAGLRAAFAEQKARRLAQLTQMSQVIATPARLVGWVEVHGTGSPVELGTDPDSERTAVSVVWDELVARGFKVDDRQNAGVGYDLLARHLVTGEHRLVEVKGQAGELGAVMLEQHEWAQAQQRGSVYWLYVVTACATAPTITVRVRDPAGFFAGPRIIQRFQIPLSELRRAAISE